MTLGRILILLVFILVVSQALYLAMVIPAAAQSKQERQACYNRCIVQYERMMKSDEGSTHKVVNYCRQQCAY
jgi:hypothetical protein